ncbi:S8 family serine peptidase [Fulvivirga sediminis]|uniref:S8 family serine peptidase n=1 Tax=Fulvivirga sediminis TaxID=2803949 RepID=A0A937F8S5_9BACT|nr:S8 family serine peptidase [Fulvivirga sediminis]MBL3656073.1 S8 family serine peptidase [Fulvivirga sediminis]
MKKLILFTFILFYSLTGCAQQKYWIYFKDKIVYSSHKATSDYFDIPISSLYQDSLLALGVAIQYQSKWLNAVTAHLTPEKKLELQKLGFIQSISPVNENIKVLSSTQFGDNNLALEQIKADTLIKLHWHAQGVKIGIIDGGFLGANKEETLSPIIDEKRVIAYKNYIEESITDPYVGVKRFQDHHGTKVWKCIGGYSSSKEKYFGLASEAEYYLARTDQGDKEHRGEEDYWVAALEWMHEQGVTLVNSSLGYSTGFTNPKENYSPENANGKFSAISRAASIAAKKKGMIIIVSAGNDGGNKFKVVSLPADAEGVITVGATGYQEWNKQFYSAIGPEALSYVKPDLSCFSASGTSFSAPIITGLIASIKGAHPTLSHKTLIKMLKASCHLHDFPNNYIGSGVPNAHHLLSLIAKEPSPVSSETITSKTSEIKITLTNDNIVAFHKSDKTNVISQKIMKHKKGVVTVKREDNVQRTTLATPDKIVEIIWK